MIDELHVRNVALIRDASIEPAAGLTVLTGETGAGKTALLSSIKLLVGERADAGMVREGAPALEVEGRLFLPGDDEDGTVVRRRVGADGRGRVDVDGHMASVRELAQRVGATVDLCGQHEHQRLLSVQTHVDMLDSWAGGPAADALGAYRDALAAAEAAASELERVREMGRALESSLIDIEDVASELRDYADGVDFDPEELERLQERLARLEGLRRAYGPSMADVLRRRDEAREVVEAASDGGELERRAAEELRRREAALAKAADALDAVRAEAAPRLARAVSEQMAFLEMGSAELVVSQERLPRAEWTRSGASRVEFLYRPGAGLTARPLRKIASGGEVSRVMLACKVVLGEADDCETLVFDEVDAGVGGATAVALASVLARLAATHQVIVVTHLAQVAVAAERHYLVRKSEGESGVPETSLVEISGEDRVAEVARMLSGDTGEASRDLAREMLARRAS